MVGDRAGSSYRKVRAAAIVGAGILVLIIVAIGAIIFSQLATPDPTSSTDTCLAQYYGDDSDYEVKGLEKWQEGTVRDILRSTGDLNHPANSAALATFVAFSENGLSPKSDLNAKYVGSFQQDTSWQASYVERDYVQGEAVFGTPKDPRLDPYLSSRAFLNALKTRLKSNGVQGTPHESIQDVEAALNQLGVDTGGYSNWWKAWKAADMSESFLDPQNAGAVTTLGNWVQGFQPGGGAGTGNTAGSSNYLRKAVQGASYWEPILIASANQQADGQAYQLETINRKQAAEAAAKIQAGLSPDTAVEFDITGYAGEDDMLPGTYVLGDQLSVSLKDELEEQGIFVNAQAGRQLDDNIISSALRSVDAQTRGTWVIELGTNNGSDAASVAEIEGQMNKIRKLRNVDAPQTVYWITPNRPDEFEPFGSAKPYSDEIRRVALSQPWLRVLDWEQLVLASESSDKWFGQDGVQLVGKGQEAMSDLILGVAGTDDPLTTNSFAGCVAGGFSDEYLPTGEAIWVKGERGKFKVDGPATEDASYWLPGNLKRASNALVNAPCEDGKCWSLCAQLAARISGQAHSGQDSARSLWFAMKARGVKGQTFVANDGSDNGRAYSPPPGAMLFWDIGESGHVATYVGDGDVIHNYDHNGDGKQDVVRTTADSINKSYGKGGPQYYGWALPPNSWKEYNSKEDASAATAVRKAARDSGTSLYYR